MANELKTDNTVSLGHTYDVYHGLVNPPFHYQSPTYYQNVMPEYPDVTYDTWRKLYAGNTATRLGNTIEAWATSNPDYATWRQNELDRYNAAVSAYNSWLSTGEGKRWSAESGNYNPSYFDSGNPSMSPLSYQDASPSSGFNEMAQGVSGIFQFIQALQGMKMLSSQIAGQNLKNKQQQIINDQLESNLSFKNSILRANAYLMGFRADDMWYKTGSHLYSLFSNNREVYDNGNFSPNGLGTYYLQPFKNSPDYQRAWADIAFIRAGKQLRDINREMLGWNIKERKFYVNSIQQVYKAFLDNQLALAKGELSFQPIAQKLRKQATQWGIGINVANTAISAAKTVVGMLSPAGAAANAMSGVPSWGNLPNQSQSWGSGWDATTGEWINPYNGYQ